ncbi:MAG: hypothetical protein EOM72_11705 [Opitutae bacterium]|nr:hypothetical protein [Opitutae bacterium]
MNNAGSVFDRLARARANQSAADAVAAAPDKFRLEKLPNLTARVALNILCAREKREPMPCELAATQDWRAVAIAPPSQSPKRQPEDRDPYDPQSWRMGR